MCHGRSGIYDEMRTLSSGTRLPCRSPGISAFDPKEAEQPLIDNEALF